MDKKGTGLVILIVVLIAIVGLLGGYIIGDKLANKDNINEAPPNKDNQNNTNSEENNNQNSNTNLINNKTITYKGVEFTVAEIEKDAETANMFDDEIINVILKIENKSNSVFDEDFYWEWVNSEGESTYGGMFSYPHEQSIQSGLGKINLGQTILGVGQVAKPKNKTIKKIKAVTLLGDGPKDVFEIEVNYK